VQMTPTNPLAGPRAPAPGMRVSAPGSTGVTPANLSFGGPEFSAQVREQVKQVLKEQEDKKKADEAEKKLKLEVEGYRIGSDLTMKVNWNDGVVFSTAQQDFTLHVGGWIQWDNVWWGQSAALQTAPDGRPGPKQGVFTGVSQGGIGDLHDGTYFRRERIM